MADNRKILSIQLWLDGLYYLSGGPDGWRGFLPFRTTADTLGVLDGSGILTDGYDAVRVVLDTVKTMIVPGEFFTGKAGLLDLGGLELSPAETEVADEGMPGTRCVMGCRRDLSERLAARFGSVSYHSPFRLNMQRGGNDVLYVNLTARNAYLTLGRWPARNAAVVTAGSAEDVLYHVADTLGRHGEGRVRIIVAGAGAEEAAALLSRHFPRVAVDKDLRGDGEYANLVNLCV